MPTEYVTRTRIAVDHHGRGEAALEFAASAGKGKARASAVWRLAVIYKVSAHHPRRVRHYNPAGLDAPLPTADELRLELSGDPERIARLLSAAPRYLARVEALATKAARSYGHWTRSAAGESALEYTDAGGRRGYAARFRAEAVRGVADYLGITTLPPCELDPSLPLWDQAHRVAYDLVKAEEPVKLAELHDEAEVEELLAAADRTPGPAAMAYERELAELHAAERRRSARLFAALDGEELPADEEPVEEAAAEDVVEDQEEELPLVPLTRVQRRWLHTAAAHPAGHFPNGCNLRTLAALEAAGYVEWAPPYNHGRRLRIADSYKPNPGEVRLTAAGRRRAAREERERVVIVACGGRKAVYDSGIHKGKPVIGARAGELYVGSYHRAMRRAADVLTRGGRGGRVLILSAKWGLVELDRHTLNYDLKAGDPGTVDGETLRQQAHELGIAGAAVTVLGGRAYVSLAGEVWSDFEVPLDGTRGIGDQLARLADIYSPARRTVEEFVEDQAAEEFAAVEEPVEEAAAEDVVEDQAAAEELTEPVLGVPAATRAAELGAVRSGRRSCGGRLSRGLSRGPLSCGVTCGDSPTPPVLRRTRQQPESPSHPYRWTTARRGPELPVIGHRERVRPLISVTVAAALALFATGCVSVPAADSKPQAPHHRPAAPAPASLPSPAEASQAPARAALTRTGPAPSSSAPRRRGSAPAVEAPAPAARRAVPPPRAQAPAPRRHVRPTPSRAARPAPVRPSSRRAVSRPAHRSPTSSGYDMRAVCRAAQGVTSPSLVELCRSAYGR
ncbi:DUF6884 domain-containing protein [Streptomyces sp. NPDC020490]|uniref:DUF6884 domain-containing protein n=1 Tax=Streptomyces sp. NPDC020490 TaxID=3365078 RepID=UPI0037BB4B0C